MKQIISLNKDFLDYWSIEKPAFSEEWNSSTFFIPADHLAIHKRVQHYCERKGSLIALTAAAGHGKTTFAKWLYSALDIERHEVLLVSLLKSESKSGWLLPRVAEFLGVDLSRPISMPDLIQSISNALVELIKEHKQLCIIIDEANKLSNLESFEEIHALISAQCAIDIGISIVLLGTPDLIETIKAVSSINNRIILQSSYELLSQEETSQYINFRLQKVGLNRSVFSKESIDAVWNYSCGNFSLINAICDNSMLECYLAHTSVISTIEIERAVEFIPSLRARRAEQVQHHTLQVAGDTFHSTAFNDDKQSEPRIAHPIPSAILATSAIKVEKENESEEANKSAEGKPKKNIALASLFFDNDDDKK